MGMKIQLESIGTVRGGRVEVINDKWGPIEAVIELDAARFGPEATASLGDFSHLVVVYHFHKVDPKTIEWGARHPRENRAWPLVGIFAQRGKNRPNLVGVTTCEIVKVDGLKVHVRGLDAVDGTPVIDLKPYMTGFEPRGAVREPAWANELMAGYW
jgi:tRNA-Thr(GGU) m(6)t(6)A37 methyltransferase TsaA